MAYVMLYNALNNESNYELELNISNNYILLKSTKYNKCIIGKIFLYRVFSV